MNPGLMSVSNLALAFLGGEQLSSVEAPWEDSSLGRLCQGHFSGVLDLALEAHDWSFAKGRAVLPEKPKDRPGRRAAPWRYALPADCLRPIRLDGGFPFTLEGRDILTGAAPAVLTYIRRADDPRAWPPAFRTAVAWGLASVLASARLNDHRKQEFCQHQFNLLLSEAAARDNNSQKPSPEPSPWELARQYRRISPCPL